MGIGTRFAGVVDAILLGPLLVAPPMVDAATQAVDAVVTTGPDDAEEAAGGAMSLTPTSSSFPSRTAATGSSGSGL